MRAVIMAGGEGTRLRPFTQTIPKPLLPIGRKPIAQIIVERLRDSGIHEVTMTLGYAADLIKAFFQDGSQFGVQIQYYHEKEKLGTAGCLAHLPYLREQPFLVTNGDILTDLNYAAFLQEHTASGAAMSVGTRCDRITIPYGVLKLKNDQVTGIEEKPTLDICFNGGIYALAPACLDLIPPDGPFDMTDLMQELINSGKQVRPVALEGEWYDLAKVDDFDKVLSQLENTFNPG